MPAAALYIERYRCQLLELLKSLSRTLSIQHLHNHYEHRVDPVGQEHTPQVRAVQLVRMHVRQMDWQ